MNHSLEETTESVRSGPDAQTFTGADSTKVRVLYDSACPACHGYCELARRSDPDGIELLDARVRSDLLAEVTRRGWDIDEGMVLERSGELHYGSDAIAQLAEHGQGRGFFVLVNRLMFARPRLARILYPVLKSFRNLLLKCLGVRRINNLERPGQDRF